MLCAISQRLGIRQGQLRERPYVVVPASVLNSSFRSRSIRACRQEQRVWSRLQQVVLRPGK